MADFNLEAPVGQFRCIILYERDAFRFESGTRAACKHQTLIVAHLASLPLNDQMAEFRLFALHFRGMRDR